MPLAVRYMREKKKLKIKMGGSMATSKQESEHQEKSESQKEQSKRSKERAKKYLFTSIVLLLLWIIDYTVGRVDFFVSILLLVCAYLIKNVVLEFQMGGRRLIAEYFKENSDPRVIIESPGVISHVLAFTASCFIMVGFFVVAKGILDGHGLLPTVVIAGLFTFLLFNGLAPAEAKGEADGGDGDKSENTETGDVYQEQAVENDQKRPPAKMPKSVGEVAGSLRDGTQKYAAFVTRLVVIIVVFNLLMALVLTAHDTFKFLVADVTLSKVPDVTNENAVQYNGLNHYSRAFLNAYVMADTFKLAVANLLFEAFVGEGRKEQWFYVFYLFTVAFNIVKLAPFSVGFVFAVRGLRQRSEQIYGAVSYGYGKVHEKAAPRVNKLTEKLKEELKERLDELKNRKAQGAQKGGPQDKKGKANAEKRKQTKKVEGAEQ